ncbi:bifunctional acetate--CoA ligase family protein/GNAT family N-acetyltransferase [Variovorax sp. J2P1-59]|uniref:bifunctional acetate--CoA ligase family protein/GNAT family N-acetyltransferase n=1 Tax=Variovorax flavidus TaxID=3053501 RepID=UPI002574BA87|nr:bifunctional acetate--CoA ligase family protein/GNAT family N-acetyltransferase [Variovorax sp. J2P1-59]MDM0073298.1 bifunctional acetate--CoA ligase family protein/GNAT family N-acetyltransferase [Variovorax sp. J2P1-59]
MSVRNLEHLFSPRSVAVIGASDRPGSVGSLLVRNLRDAGFEGPVWPVNRRHASVAGGQAWSRVSELPGVPDLAVICTPPATVPALIGELGRLGTRAAVVLTSGLKARPRPNQPTYEQAMLDAARPHLLRILGPNSVGLLVPGVRLNASFAHATALPGPLGFVSQSGALARAMLDWANAHGIGFSHFISLGDGADVDFGDALDYLASDSGTRAILMYVETIREARKFMSAARAAARNKPVIVVKAGRAPEGAKAAASHTGALAGSDAVFDAAVRRAGMLRVNSLSDLFDAAATLARAKPLRGRRLAILTNGGGAGVLAADALSLRGGELSSLSAETLALLDQSLPAAWSHANPIDIMGDAPVERYIASLEALGKAQDVDAVLFMHAPTAVVSSADIAKACIPAFRASRRPVLTCWMGGHAVAEARQRCEEAAIPTYDTPERAVNAFLHLVEYRRNQDALLEAPAGAPEAFAPDRAKAQAIVAGALQAGRALLDESEAKALFGLYGIPVVETRTVTDVASAIRQAEAIGFPVVLKILSPDISHKSDVGGVALGLDDRDAVAQAADAMLRRVRELRPDAHLAGFTVQSMVKRPRAHELIVGMATDAVMGPVMLFGHGGTAVEVIRDREVALPPLNRVLASDLVARTRVARLLAGYSDRPRADHEAIYAVLERVSQLICDLPEVVELDINPLLADENGVIALDGRLKVERATTVGTRRLAIRPYPSALEQRVTLGGQSILIRPIRPEDGVRFAEFYSNCAPRDIRLRFFVSRRDIPHSELARYTQIDYDREMAFVAMAPDASGEEVLLGEVHAVCDPDNVRAEFAIQVRSGQQQKGLGRLLLDRMIEYLRSRGTQQLAGECLEENEGMKRLAREAGFTIGALTRDRSVPFALDLQGASKGGAV